MAQKNYTYNFRLGKVVNVFAGKRKINFTVNFIRDKFEDNKKKNPTLRKNIILDISEISAECFVWGIRSGHVFFEHHLYPLRSFHKIP
jgi:hypothetical protein